MTRRAKPSRSVHEGEHVLLTLSAEMIARDKNSLLHESQRRIPRNLADQQKREIIFLVQVDRATAASSVARDSSDHRLLRLARQRR
jgi:hypothetical protein